MLDLSSCGEEFNGGIARDWCVDHCVRDDDNRAVYHERSWHVKRFDMA